MQAWSEGCLCGTRCCSVRWWGLWACSATLPPARSATRFLHQSQWRRCQTWALRLKLHDAINTDVQVVGFSLALCCPRRHLSVAVKVIAVLCVQLLPIVCPVNEPNLNNGLAADPVDD